MSKKIFSDEEKVLQDSLAMMRHAVKKVNDGIRHFELALDDVSQVWEEQKFEYPLCEKIEFLDIDFHLRIPEFLGRVGVSYLWQLCSLNESDFRGIYGIGARGIEETKKALEKNGLSLGRTSRVVTADLVFRFSVPYYVRHADEYADEKEE